LRLGVVGTTRCDTSPKKRTTLPSPNPDVVIVKRAPELRLLPSLKQERVTPEKQVFVTGKQLPGADI
jgi:hypothetical protein